MAISVPVISVLGIMLSCGPGGILGIFLLVLVPQCVGTLMGLIIAVTTGLWAHRLRKQSLYPLWMAFLRTEA